MADGAKDRRPHRKRAERERVVAAVSVAVVEQAEAEVEVGMLRTQLLRHRRRVIPTARFD